MADIVPDGTENAVTCIVGYAGHSTVRAELYNRLGRQDDRAVRGDLYESPPVRHDTPAVRCGGTPPLKGGSFAY